MVKTGIEIVRQDTETTFNGRGEPVEKIRVQFTVDGDGPFFARFDRDGFTGAAAKVSLEDFARELRALKGF